MGLPEVHHSGKRYPVVQWNMVSDLRYNWQWDGIAMRLELIPPDQVWSMPSDRYVPSVERIQV